MRRPWKTGAARALAPLELLVVVLTVVVLLVVAPASRGGVNAGNGGATGSDPSGDIHAKGLTNPERAAMHITSVRVDGADNLGVFVTVTFKGDFQKLMGRGHLAHAAAALILRPKPGQALSAGLISEGSGKIGVLYRHTRSTNVGAFRRGRKLTFFILGPGYAKVKSVVVETVANVFPLPKAAFGGAGSQASRRLASGEQPPYIGPRLWTKFLSLHPIDLHVQTADPSALSCPELQNLLDSIDADLEDPYFSQNVSFAVTKALHAFRATVKGLLDKCAPPPTVNALFSWSPFSSNEVAGSGQFTGPPTTFSDVRVVLPGTFTITNHLCPGPLPNAIISGNRIDCNGGALSTGQTFTLNLQTSPFPSAGMGGQLFGISNGTVLGPFTITGP